MIVVTGGAGFIGSAVIARLNDLGYDNIIVVDHLRKKEKWKNLVGLKFQDFINKDTFYDLIVDDRVPFSMDSAIHLGACSATTEDDSDFLLQNNYRYSLEFVKYCLPRRTRFIYASSAATYGAGEKGYSDSINIDELKPLNMYGYSKHLFDIWCRNNEISSKIVGLKYFNVFGPNEYHKENMRSVVNKAFEQILETGKIKLFKSDDPKYKDGEQMRDFIYVKDAVEMTLYFFENRDKSGVFNIGTGKARTWNDLAKSIFDALGKPVNIEYVDMPEELKGKYQNFTQAEISKMTEAGFNKKTHTLEEGVTDYIQNYLLKEKYIGLTTK